MKGDGVVRVEVWLTTQTDGKTHRSKMSGVPLDGHLQFSMSREHTVVTKKGKNTFVPSKECSLMLYMKYKPDLILKAKKKQG